MKLKDLKYMLMLPVMTLLVACAGNTAPGSSLGGESDDFDGGLVINELMANNRTGLCDESGVPADWVEIKSGWKPTPNPSLKGREQIANGSQGQGLNGFALAVVKKKGKVTNVPLDGVVTNDEGFAVVFVKLPKEGKVQLLDRNGEVMSEVTYPALEAGEAFARCEDGSYEQTRWQSPGFENDAEGYEAFCRLMDDSRNSQLLIWEVFSRAEKRKDCWVELKNVSNDTVDLEGYALGKDLKNSVEVNELLKASKPKKPKKASKADEGVVLMPGKSLVVPFKISSSETVVLAKDGKFVDGVCAKPTYFGTSVGRTVDGKGFYYFASATRGGENTAHPYRFIAEKPEIEQTPSVLQTSPPLRGESHSVSVFISHSSHRTVHYTLDGSSPTSASPVWQDSLMISENTTIRAYAEGDSMTMRSDVATRTFLMNEPHTVPVVNITIDSADMYDYNRGIYADGPGYTSQWPHKGANYWKSWTKRAHVEFEDINTDCGFKIFGGYSRYEAKKSFTVKFMNSYGASKFEYDYFGTGEPVELNDMVLRSGSQDWNRCMVRDEFFTSLMAPHCPTLLVQAYRPVALYINGGYFGLYYIREKIDHHFVARKLGTSEDSVTIIASSQYLEAGTKAEYNSLMNYIRSHNMADQEAYEYVRDRVDVQGLIDFKLGEIYSGNTDVGNVRQVRSSDSNCDGKWYFVFYDIDASWVGYKPTASYYLRCGSDAQQGGLHNRMINSLLVNKEFRQLFMERLSYHMHKTFSTKNATEVFDALVNIIRPEMERNCERWPQLSYKQWEKNIADFRARFADKHKVMLNDLRQLLSITPEEEQKYFSDLGF